MFTIQPLVSKDSFKVKCYMEWGGYTYLMDRQHNGTEINFNRNWHDYRNGFGDLDKFETEFWLGLEKIYAITSTKTETRTFSLDFTIRLQKTHLLRDHNYYQSYYSDFYIGSEVEGYCLHINSYSAHENRAGDSLLPNSGSTESALGQKFSTFDQDNDQSASNCAEVYGGGWWYNDCTAACPTCPRLHTQDGYRDKNVVASMFWKYDLDDYVLNFFDVKTTVTTP